MEKSIHLPVIVGGKKVYPNEDRENYIISYDSGVKVVIPTITNEEIQQLQESNKYILHDLNIQEIISFFVKVGKFWRVNNLNNPLYEEALVNLCLINGYDKKMAIRELNIIGSACSQLSGMYDLIDLELGNRFYLEEWVPRGDVLVHVQPVGNVLNIMVGNVPVSGIMSLLRSSLTKNQTIAKIPKRDPITVMYFVMSMIELFPDHPITRSMNVLYWPGGNEIESTIIDMANAVCVWGSEQAVKSIRSKVKNGVNVVEFGPKMSYALVGKESVNCEKVAIDLAHDISIYNQEACFSPQIAFVEGNYKLFIEHLKMGLKLYSKLFPKGTIIADANAHVSRTRLEALYNGNEVYYDDQKEWTIITINSLDEINEHPLNRVIFVKPIKNITDCLEYIDETVQTIAISPWDRNVEIREIATLKGAAKVTEIGLVEAMRNGSTHDNVYPMQHLVRWVCVERGCDYWGKYIEDGPLDTTKWIMMNEKELENIDAYLENDVI
ncbi:MAG: hypothetical protein CVU84_14640 [Firmicutes bacterium HGW-Firmicutes-1]|jgi:long-chain-fatty-acyl-CoA reductase|nr:MAG: hypothetical protein CVU84_14640 [Firmicutes bacterium HGW-Firmicutes-1]